MSSLSFSSTHPSDFPGSLLGKKYAAELLFVTPCVYKRVNTRTFINAAFDFDLDGVRLTAEVVVESVLVNTTTLISALIATTSNVRECASR